MTVIAGIFMLSCLVFHGTAFTLPEATEAEVWDAWTAHVDKYHNGDSQFLQRDDRYEAFRETFNFVNRQNARHAAGESGFTVELNYRAAYLPHERTSGSFQPADSSRDNDESQFTSATSRRLLHNGPCGPGHPRCFPGYCCGGNNFCSKNPKICSNSNCQPAYGDCIHSNATGLSAPPLTSQFFIPSIAQAVQFQYESVPKSSLLDSVDWRPYVNEVQDQGLCGNCWAYSAAEAISAATAIATGPKPNLSIQQLTDCSSGSEFGPGKGCLGGFPDLALNWIALRGSLGVASDTSYPNIKKDQVCQGNGEFGASISGYGYVPKNSELALMRALRFQPVIVNIKTGFSFQTYSGGILDDPACGNEVDHAVLAVGYGTDEASGKKYWILMNSWGKNWGDKGFIKVAMTGQDFTNGICGLYVNRPSFPIIKPLSDPCALEPCGGGVCENSSTAHGGYRCTSCPKGFVVLRNPDGSDTCGNNPCKENVANPCGFGQCLFDSLLSTQSRRFAYTCKCPPGTVLGSFSDGSPTCTSGSRTYTVTRSDVVCHAKACKTIARRTCITVAVLKSLNAGLNCSAIRVGQILTVSVNVPDPGCTRTQSARKSDTCQSLQAASGLAKDKFLALNPNLDCSSIPVNFEVCLAGSPSGLLAVGCGQYKTYLRRTRCSRIVRENSITQATLVQLNPGIHCRLRATRPVCIQPRRSVQSVRCGKFWTVQAGNTCWQIWTTFGLTEPEYTALNPGISCDFLQIGQHVCVQAFSAA